MDKRLRILLTVFLLLLCTVGITWCGTICAAKALTVASCSHEAPVQICDDPASTVPDVALVIPASSVVWHLVSSDAILQAASTPVPRFYRVPIAPLRI